MQRIYGLLLTIALAACAGQSLEKLHEANAACEARYPLQRGNARGRAGCFEAAENQYLKPTSGLELRQATRAALAGEVDAGTISPDDYRLRLAQLDAQQDEADRAARLQALGAAASLGLLNPVPQAPILRPYIPAPLPPPSNFNCMTVGMTTNCTGY